jgi:hypothetical protein
MRYVTTAVVVLLAVLFIQGQAVGQKKAAPAPQAPKWAKVTLGGEIRDLLELRAKHNLYVLLDREIPALPDRSQWQGPQPPRPLSYPVRSMQVGDAAWVVTLLDDTSENLKAFLPKLQAGEQPIHVVMEGAIAAAPKDVEPFVTYANAAGKLRAVGKGPLGMGEIKIEGNALPGKYEISKGNFTFLAIENGTSPILVIGEGLARVSPSKGKARVSGKLIVQKQGPLVVDAQSVTIENPPPKMVPKKKAK